MDPKPIPGKLAIKSEYILDDVCKSCTYIYTLIQTLELFIVVEPHSNMFWKVRKETEEASGNPCRHGLSPGFSILVLEDQLPSIF